jgi:hypothetical protein
MLRLYTDESPGLKVDPVVVLVLSLVFIFSVVALHSELFFSISLRCFDGGGFCCCCYWGWLWANGWDHTVIAKITRKFSS